VGPACAPHKALLRAPELGVRSAVMRVWRVLSRASLACVVLGLFGCAGPRPEVKAALVGSLPELKQEIARAERSGQLSDSHVTDLARAVAEREIAGASGVDAAAQLALFRPCLPVVESALDERSSRGDEGAATATLLLLEAGKREASELVARYQDADSGAFRALAARAALAPAQAELRRRYFTDPDERVRRAAFEAALRAPLASDLPDLAEAARLDPSPANRARAAQALGRIGSEPAVLGLLDLFSGGDEQQQLAVLDAWSESPSFSHGGERELARALDRSGMVGVSAASLLLQSRDSRAAALAVLTRAIEGGSDEERRLAAMVAPLSEPGVKAALQKAASAPSPEVTPVVLSRLAELSDQLASARKSLEKLAEDKSEYGLEASYAAAQLGSARALTRVQQELSDARASHRLRAALLLARLGQKRSVAACLADDDPFVRASLACSLVGSH
jgi:HEAT repeat protein